MENLSGWLKLSRREAVGLIFLDEGESDASSAWLLRAAKWKKRNSNRLRHRSTQALFPLVPGSWPDHGHWKHCDWDAWFLWEKTEKPSRTRRHCGTAFLLLMCRLLISVAHISGVVLLCRFTRTISSSPVSSEYLIAASGPAWWGKEQSSPSIPIYWYIISNDCDCCRLSIAIGAC